MKERFEYVVHHCEQSKRNYCVVACTCMVLSRRGEEIPQDAICATWLEHPHGFALRDAAEFLKERAKIQAVDPDWENQATFDWMRTQLQHSRWIIAYTFAREIARVMQALPPEPDSPFGPMSSEGLHAVVLVDADDERFYYLDPYYRASGQPFSMSNEDFALAFQGSAFAVRIG